MARLIYPDIPGHTRTLSGTVRPENPDKSGHTPLGVSGVRVRCPARPEQGEMSGFKIRSPSSSKPKRFPKVTRVSSDEVHHHPCRTRQGIRVFSI